MADQNISVEITQQQVSVAVEQGAQTAVVQQSKTQRVTVYQTGPQGPPGQAQNTYIHNQTTPTSIWTIDHNLGFWPNVIVYDTDGREAEGSIINPTVNRTTITFSAPFAGSARLS